jgi:RNA polymerase sigma-70 factor, ECF subfamily
VPGGDAAASRVAPCSGPGSVPDRDQRLPQRAGARSPPHPAARRGRPGAEQGTDLGPRAAVAPAVPRPLLEPAAPSDTEPDAMIVSREMIELAYLAAIQHLPPRQRAILILRDALGWPAKETAALLDTTVASVNSALQRARSTMRTRLPERRLDWTAITEPTDRERAVLQQYMQAYERSDVGALVALLREDARQTMPPAPLWFDGARRWPPSTGGSSGPDRPARSGTWPPPPTGSRRRPATSGGTASPSTGSRGSTCCGSRTAGSWRSPSSPRAPPGVRSPADAPIAAATDEVPVDRGLRG